MYFYYKPIWIVLLSLQVASEKDYKMHFEVHREGIIHPIMIMINQIVRYTALFTYFTLLVFQNRDDSDPADFAYLVFTQTLMKTTDG